MTEQRARIWVGTDAGKGHHWAAAVGESGFQLWSRKINNDEASILEAIAEALAMADVVDRAIDLSGTASALLLALDERINDLDRHIKETFRAHPQAHIIESMPGIGPIPGAELLVAAGDLSAFADAGRLASAAGPVPVPRDSGRCTGNLHRPTRSSRRLRRGFHMSAQTSIIKDGPTGTPT